MARSYISVTQGSGTKMATNNYTDGADSKHDELVVFGEQFLPTYTVSISGTSIATANDHVIALNAGASLKLRIRRIYIRQAGLAGAANTGLFEIRRLTSLGTGGSTLGPANYDPTDATAGATAKALPTAKGTETDRLQVATLTMVAAQPTTGIEWEWRQMPGTKPIIVPAGTANGIAIKSVTAIASATVAAVIEFDESAY